MQVAINPTLYGNAKTYADQRGLNLTVVIENFLKRFISSKDAEEEDIPDAVLSLIGAAGGQLDSDDLNGRKAYYSYIEEKYK